MTVTPTSESLTTLSVDTLVIPLPHPVTSIDTDALTDALGASFVQALRNLGGEVGDTIVFYPETSKAEQVVLDYIKAGNPTPAGLKEARSECVRMIKELGERVRAKMALTTG